MNKIKLLSFSLLAVVIFFAGCTTKELEVNSNMSKSIFINPVKKELRTVFVSTKNTSGKQINLNSAVLSELISKGYKIVDDPEEATYLLLANILYCDVKKQDNTGLGVVGGAAAGGTISQMSGSDNALPGVVIGGLAGGIIGSQFEDITFQMQVDVVIREKSKTVVSTSTSGVEGSARARYNNRDNAYKTEVSGRSQGYKTNYIEHKTVMYSEAKRSGLTLQEARPVLETLIANQIVGLF